MQSRSVGSVLREYSAVRNSTLLNENAKDTLRKKLHEEVFVLAKAGQFCPETLAACVRVSKEIAGSMMMSATDKAELQALLQKEVARISAQSDLTIEKEIADKERKRVEKTPNTPPAARS